MRKYFTLFRVTVAEYFVYRLNFALWRIRVILNLILIYFLWSSIYLQNRDLFGYSREMMLTYVLLVSMLSDLLFSSKIHEVGVEILQGGIINKLLKPISFFSYLIVREVADKSVNMIFSISEILILISLTAPTLSIPQDTSTYFFFALQIVLGLILSFFISLSISTIAFWTAEIWAPRFIYFILVFMLAGNYFPLDILPPVIFRFLLLTPFPYFIFLPAQIFIKGISPLYPLELVMTIVWICLAYLLARYLWTRGIKEYSFFGR